MKKLMKSLRKAAEMMYQSEMKDTAMDYLEIKEVGAHEDQDYSWNTKEEWIKERMDELLA